MRFMRNGGYARKIKIFIVTLLFLVTFLHLTLCEKIPDLKQKDDDPQILWWHDLSAPSFGSSAVGDIDEDGNLEIVFGTYFNDEHVYALNAEDGSLLWSYDTGGCNDASPAIADVDLDGHLEVIIPASSPYQIYCFNGSNGQIKWQQSTGYPNCIDSPPAVADVDTDGKPEIIFGTFYGNVFCLNGEDGGICWQQNLGVNSYIQSGPDILDTNNDGQLDVVVAQFAGDCRIYSLSGNNGSVQWYSSVSQDYLYHGGSFADIDEDGRPEIVIGSYDSHLYVLNAEDGSLCWAHPDLYYIGAPTSIGDLNNDGYFEIVYASYNKITVLSHNNTSIWNYITGDTIFRGAAISDIDGNGILDVVFGSDDGILRALRGDTGQVIWTYDLQAHYGNVFQMDHAPVIADFNKDGKLDVFIIGGYGSSQDPENNYGRAYALSAGEGTGVGWYMFRHDLRHSACFSTQENQPPNPPQPPQGPVNGSTNIYYTYTTETIDPDGDELYYEWDWGDDQYSEWLGPYPSGSTIEASHAWVLPGDYNLRVKAKDEFHNEGIWSKVVAINIIDPLIPRLDIESISGGLEIQATLRNNGSGSLTNVVWNITVTGGIAHLLNKTISHTILSIPVNNTIVIHTGLLFGFGTIKIVVSAICNELNKPIETTQNGFLLICWIKTGSPDKNYHFYRS